MSRRIDRSWLVFASVESREHDRCVDIFLRPDGSYGFEAFRRDVEDQGAWTPVSFYADNRYSTLVQALEAAERAVAWLAELLRRAPDVRIDVLGRDPREIL